MAARMTQKLTQTAESVSSKLTKIAFEEGVIDDEDRCCIDLRNSLDDMIKFTEKLTHRMTPLASQTSLKTEISNPDCHCGCHEAEEDLQFINEKTQTDSQLLYDHGSDSNQRKIEHQEVEEEIREISSKPSEQKPSVKSSTQLLKDIYTEIKVCRCFEKYTKNKKKQETKKPKSIETMIKQEVIQDQGVLDHDEEILKALSNEDCSPKNKVEKNVSKDTVKSKKSILKPILSLIDLDASSSSEKKKRSSKNDFVDVDLVRNESLNLVE
jgi:hypothetical protein